MKSIHNSRTIFCIRTLTLVLVFWVNSGVSIAKESISTYLQAGASMMLSNHHPFIDAAGVYNKNTWILGYTKEEDRQIPSFTKIEDIYDWTVNYNLMHNSDVHLFSLYGALEENYRHWQKLWGESPSQLDFSQYQSLLTTYCETLSGSDIKFLTAFYGAGRGKYEKEFVMCREWLDTSLSLKPFLAHHYGFDNSPVVLAPEWGSDEKGIKPIPLVSYRFNPLFRSNSSASLYASASLHASGGKLVVKGVVATGVKLEKLELDAWFCFMECQITGQNLKWAEIEAASESEDSTTYIEFGTNLFRNAPYRLTDNNNKEYLLFNTGDQLYVWLIGSEWSPAPRRILYSQDQGGFELILQEPESVELSSPTHN